MDLQPSKHDDESPRLSTIIPRPLDRKVLVILCLVPVLLTINFYLRGYARWSEALIWMLDAFGVEEASRKVGNVFVANARGELHRLYVWVAILVTTYMIIPSLVIKLVFREKLRDYGLKLKGWHRRLWVYGVAFVIVLPLVFYFGKTEAFQDKYPFYRQAGDSWFDLLAWELPYALQFLALEFFFRGLLIHGLKHRFGFYCVFVMVVPYCMIHFGKPPAETFGAIIAGIVLGTMSLWTRSILLGFLIHVSVAWSMDLTALWYKDQLGALFG